MNTWEKNVRRVVPYVPGEQPQRPVIKLNTNENPYPPSPGVQRELTAFDSDQLRLYPDPEAKELVEAIAAAKGAGVRGGRLRRCTCHEFFDVFWQ